ncbi:MAG: DUF4339 domain-containing protein [Fimbriimonadaceae bacterium]|nr:DUF4339 domain-containing protein [Fimbriimonadaceae bacterium]
MADWYYIGHYGQLGPLTLDQMGELVQGGVIQRETYVWRTGLASWDIAVNSDELGSFFLTVDPLFASPPPPPTMSPSVNAGGGSTQDPMRWTGAPAAPLGYANPSSMAPYPISSPPGGYLAVQSEKSRVAAGLLNLLIPGVGRMYMGYAAIGVLQLVFFPCFVGWIWSLIDGILILSGSPKVDGYGRVMDR